MICIRPKTGAPSWSDSDRYIIITVITARALVFRKRIRIRDGSGKKHSFSKHAFYYNMCVVHCGCKMERRHACRYYVDARFGDFFAQPSSSLFNRLCLQQLLLLLSLLRLDSEILRGCFL